MINHLNLELITVDNLTLKTIESLGMFYKLIYNIPIIFLTFNL